MSTFVIGDVQGCFQPLLQLLEKISFDKTRDKLWFTGDLVNRGSQSLEVLRFVYELGDKHQTVLGNHDLHLLAVAAGTQTQRDGDTLTDILSAPDKAELLDWLRHRPLLIKHENIVMTHAGLAPAWTVEKAQALAREVETVLRGDDSKKLFEHMYGNQPDQWRDDLTGYDRLRCIINYFTRMRFCHADGRLNLSNKGAIKDKDEHLMPWFEVVPRANADAKIIFGHWAALEGVVDVPNLFALDTGCVWGNKLTAMRLEDEVRFAIPCDG